MGVHRPKFLPAFFIVCLDVGGVSGTAPTDGAPKMAVRRPTDALACVLAYAFTRAKSAVNPVMSASLRCCWYRGWVSKFWSADLAAADRRLAAYRTAPLFMPA